MEGMTLEKLQVIIEAQTKAYYEELKKVQQQTKSATSAVEKQTEKIKSAFGKIGKAIGLALSVTAIISFGKSCIQLGSDLAEVQNVVDVTFGAMSETINRFARDALEEFGLSETSAKKYTSTMGAMLKSMGFTTQAAAEMSMEMTGLAADMASFYNLDSQAAFDKIRAGISGETEPLKQLGINMSVANLQAYALSQGITKSYNAMTQQEQAMLRYNYLMQATADAQGDFARTSDSWANQVRVLTERFNALKAAIGQGLIAVLTPVIKVLNQLLAKILTVTDAFSNMVAKLTGKNTKTTTTVSGIGDAADSAAVSMGGVGDATEAAGKSAKKAAKEYGGLLSMDEIHSLTKNEGSDSGGSGGAGGASGSGLSENIVDAATETDDKLNPVLDKLITTLKELKDLFTEGFKAGLGDVDLSGITKAVDGIKTSLKNIFTAPEVLQAANNFANTLAYSLGQQAGAAASVGITIATNILGGIDKYLADNQGRIKQFIVNMFDIGSEIVTIQGNFAQAAANIFSVFGGENGQQVTANIIGIFADAAMGAYEISAKLGRDVLDCITRPFIDNQEGFKTAIDGLLGVAAECLESLKGVIDSVVDSANSIYDEHFAPLFDSLASGLSEITAVVLEFWNTNVQPVLQQMGEKFDELMVAVEPVLQKILELFGSVADAIKVFWNGVLVPLIEWIVTNVGPVVLPIIELIYNTVINVAAGIAQLIGGLIDVIRGIIDFVVSVFTGDWQGAWDAIMLIVQGVFDAIAGIIRTVLGTIAGIIGTVLSTIGGIFSTILNGIKSLVQTVFNAIFTVIKTIITSVKNNISTALGSIKTIWNTTWNSLKTSVSTIFNDIWSTIKKIINSIIGGIEGMCNAVVNGVNTVINAMNNLSFEIPDWVPGMGGKTFGFNIPTLSSVSLPRLAMGGIVDKATPLIAGEAGKEAIVPLENNTGWMDKLGARLGEIISVNIMGVLENAQTTAGEMIVKTFVQIDGKTIVEQTDKYRGRQGYSMKSTPATT